MLSAVCHWYHCGICTFSLLECMKFVDSAASLTEEKDEEKMMRRFVSLVSAGALRI